MAPSEETAAGLRSLLVSVRRERELAHAALPTEKKHAEDVETALRELQSKGDIDEALRRIRELKALGCVPFAQPYRDFTGGTKPSREAWRLAYWCNNKRLFNAMDFADYTCK